MLNRKTTSARTVGSDGSLRPAGSKWTAPTIFLLLVFAAAGGAHLLRSERDISQGATSQQAAPGVPGSHWCYDAMSRKLVMKPAIPCNQQVLRPLNINVLLEKAAEPARLSNMVPSI